MPPPPPATGHLSSDLPQDLPRALCLLFLLCAQLPPRVRDSPELFTMLWVPNSFVVPGARFREVYYWDSLWVIKGLLVSRLNSIAEVRVARQRPLQLWRAVAFLASLKANSA